VPERTMLIDRSGIDGMAARTHTTTAVDPELDDRSPNRSTTPSNRTWVQTALSQ
jgi:hypothetical protein